VSEPWRFLAGTLGHAGRRADGGRETVAGGRRRRGGVAEGSLYDDAAMEEYITDARL